MTDRYAIHAYVTQLSHETLNNFAEEHGVSVTGLIEAMCVNLAEMILVKGMDFDLEWVKAARKIDAKRRRRG
jgi:hypothetical protein